MLKGAYSVVAIASCATPNPKLDDLRKTEKWREIRLQTALFFAKILTCFQTPNRFTEEITARSTLCGLETTRI